MALGGITIALKSSGFRPVRNIVWGGGFFLPRIRGGVQAMVVAVAIMSFQTFLQSKKSERADINANRGKTRFHRNGM